MSATILFKENNGPPAEIVAAAAAASPSASTDEQRKTHIEVCIRIRPMLQGSVRESSNGFLLNNNNNHASSSSTTSSSGNTTTANNTAGAPGTTTTTSSLLRRSSGISRLPGLFRPTSSSANHTNNNTPRKQQPEEQSQQTPLQYAWKVEDDELTNTVRQTTDLIPGRTHAYTLDHVYGPECSTSDVYEHSVQDLVRASMDGYHTSVLAYGQTSTGKTHTITGTAQQPGLLPRAVRECFAYLQNDPNAMGREFLLRVSYLEVYKENIRDLLAVSTPGSAPTPIRLFEAPDQGLIIKGLREQVVSKLHYLGSSAVENPARDMFNFDIQLAFLSLSCFFY
jgi:Kinesin motor domain